MQLFGSSSTENGNTSGLALIPSKVESIDDNKSHIGWNSLEQIREDKFFEMILRLKAIFFK